MPEDSGCQGNWPARSTPPQYRSDDICWKVTNLRLEEPSININPIFKNYEAPKLQPLDDENAFHKAGEVGKLFVTYGEDRDRECVERFMVDFLEECESWDIKIAEVLPPQKVHLPSELARKENLLQKIVDESANDKTPPFVLFFISSNFKRDDNYRELLETLCQLRIMFIKMESAFIALGDDERMDHIMREFNVNIGGLNFDEDPNNFSKSFSEDNLLIVSYCVAHPYIKSQDVPLPREWAGDIPSIVGISANFTANPRTFVADFDFQQAWQEQVSPVILQERVKWLIDKRRMNTGRLPDHIVFIRDGLPNEGIYEPGFVNSTLREELAHVRAACHEFKSGYKPKFGVLYVCSGRDKRMTYRDFRFDDKEMSYKINLRLVKLAAKHQVFGSYIRTPQPVRTSSLMTKRAGRIFSAFRDFGFVLPRLDDAFVRHTLFGEAPMSTVDWPKMSDILSYKDKKLEELH